MARERSNRIDVNAAEQSRPGLNAAFSGLNLQGLPAGDTAPVPEENPGPQWKLGRVVLRRETAQRGGKVVVVVDDFATHLPMSVIERLAKKLRAACGCGGTCRGRSIELQGDQPGRVRELLEAEGFKVAGVR
jgi:translation initiation factor 1